MNTRFTKIAIGMAGSIAALCSGTANAGDVILNTGYDHSVGTNGAPYAIGDKDDYWIKIASYEPPAAAAPVDAANVVPVPPYFQPPAPGTQWIAHNPTALSGGTGGLFKGYHIYRKCFCLNDAVGQHQIELELRADDTVQVWMNDTLHQLIAPRSGSFSISSPNPIKRSFAGARYLKPGQNCIYVMVEDFGGYSAFNLKGKVTGALKTPAFGPNMEFGECCDEVNGGSADQASAATEFDPKELEAAVEAFETARQMEPALTQE